MRSPNLPRRIAVAVALALCLPAQALARPDVGPSARAGTSSSLRIAHFPPSRVGPDKIVFHPSGLSADSIKRAYLDYGGQERPIRVGPVRRAFATSHPIVLDRDQLSQVAQSARGSRESARLSKRRSRRARLTILYRPEEAGGTIGTVTEAVAQPDEALAPHEPSTPEPEPPAEEEGPEEPEPPPEEEVEEEGPGEPEPPVATADFYVSTSGSDGNPGTESQPFKTLNKAYRTASPGDVVEVAGGTYTGYNAIELDTSKQSATSPVTFVADGEAHFAAQGDVDNRLDIFADHIAFKGSFNFDWVWVKQKSWAESRGPKDVTFEGTWIHSMIFYGMVSHVRLLDNKFGPNNVFANTGAQRTVDTGSDDILDFYWGGSPLWSPDKINTDIKVIGNSFAGAYHAWNGSHSDCIQFSGVSDTVVAQNTFRHCYDETIMVKGDSGNLNGLTIENNFMSPASGENPYAIQVMGDVPCVNCSIRFNSIAENDYAMLCLCKSGTDSAPNTNSRIYGNITYAQDSWQCAPSIAQGWSWDYNVFVQGPVTGTCGTHAMSATQAVYANPDQLDPTLAPDSPAIDFVKGSGAQIPSDDIRSIARPQGGFPDAGAYELTH